MSVVEQIVLTYAFSLLTALWALTPLPLMNGMFFVETHHHPLRRLQVREMSSSPACRPYFSETL